MMKKGWIMLSSAVLTLGLAGCGGNDNAGGNNNAGENNNGQQVQNQNRPRILNDDRNNRTLRISDRAERQVEKMEEVSDARVIISNNNAYVTVKLGENNNNNGNGTNNGDNGAGAGGGTGTTGTGAGAGTYGTGTGTNGAAGAGRGTGMAAGNNNADRNGNARVNDTFDGNNNGNAMENGTVNQSDNGSDGMIDGKGDAGKGNRKNGNGNNNNDGGTNIFGAGNGNNNGANGNNGGDNVDGDTEYSEVSNAFEQRIADQVRKADKRIHKVFVSLDTDLYNRMGTYAEDIRTNRDRDGLFDNFNADMNDFFGRNNNNNR